MSSVFVCDNAACGAGALGSFDGNRWRPPAGWRTLALDDWEIHGCCEACFAAAVAETTALTPAAATREWIRLRLPGRRPESRPPPSREF